MKRWIWLAGAALLGVGLLRALPSLPVPAVYGSEERRVLAAGAPALSVDVSPADAAQAQERTTILILGVDERADDAGRSDTMMVTALDPSGQDLPLLSLPRDTWADIPGHGWDKISHAYAFGGEPLAMQAVKELLDLSIDHYVVVNFQGFKSIVDAVGGVDIRIEQAMDYEDPYDGENGLHIHFQPGLQHLDGQKALEYARFRSDPSGDVGRIRRQQELLKAVMDRALRPEMVLRLPALARAMAETVRTDLSVSQLVKLASQARALSGAPAVTSIVLTPVGDRYFHGVFYSVLDRVAARTAAYRALVGGDPPADYLARARAAETSLQEVLAGEDRLARAAVAAALPGSPTDAAAADPGSGQAKTPESGAGQSGPQTGAAAGGSEGGPVQPTVALVNLSGQQTQSRWLTLLRSNGFRVVTVSGGTRKIPNTVIVDRSGGDAEMLNTLKRLFPGARVVQAPPNGEFAAEVQIGKDAASGRSTG